MALKPVLKLKVDELFLKWLSDPDVQEELRECLSQVLRGEPITYASHQASSAARQQQSYTTSRVRIGSPTMGHSSSPPPGTKVASSPRSPRRQTSHRRKEEKSLQNGGNPGSVAAAAPPALTAPAAVAIQTATKVQLRDKDRPTVAATALTSSQPSSSAGGINGSLASRKVGYEEIPKFYYPTGRPSTAGASDPAIAQALQNVADVFSTCEGGKMYKHQMHSLAKACGLPLYWGTLLFYACSGEKVGFITQPTFVTLWKRLCSTCFDDASKFLRLMARPGCNYLLTEDFVLLIQDIVDTHPGLQFLQDAPEFHSRYIHTVISRIFYCVNQSWSGKITIPELRKSNFLPTLAVLEEEEDINQVTDYFSYEHFYVIYCKFWELDKDHDLFISREDLSRHNDHAISSRIIDRIFSGAVTRGKHLQDGKMSYTEFVWFLLSEEDKKQPRSIEYWFRCMDVDGDGVLSMYEMEYFYEEQVQKMEDMGIEPLPFTDLICQILDMIGPRNPNAVTLADLKSCKLASVVLNTFINLEKYLDQEQKDPFASGAKEADGVATLSDWEKYAAEEYEVLVAEDNGNNDAEASYDYDDDFEPDEDDEDNDYDDDEGRVRRREPDSLARPATPDSMTVLAARGLATTTGAARPKSAKGSAPGSSAGENVVATAAAGAANDSH